MFAIDSGFKGYNSINIEFTTYSDFDSNPRIVYVENIYQKMKLVKNEYIYLYYHILRSYIPFFVCRYIIINLFVHFIL